MRSTESRIRRLEKAVALRGRGVQAMTDEELLNTLRQALGEMDQAGREEFADAMRRGPDPCAEDAIALMLVGRDEEFIACQCVRWPSRSARPRPS